MGHNNIAIYVLENKIFRLEGMANELLQNSQKVH